LFYFFFQIAARSLLKHCIENGHDKPYNELSKRYELFYKHFGDAIFCSTHAPKSANRRAPPSRHPPGRVFLRKLRPVTKVTHHRSAIKTETEMDTNELMDFYSNSSRQGPML
jgi:hypothetical protein